MLETKLLIISPEINQNISIANFFKTLNYQVFSAFTARESVVNYKIDKPQIIIVTNELPDTSSYKLVKEFRKNPDCRIIMISNNNSYSAINNAYTSGVDDFIPTPFDIQILKHKVKALENRLFENINILPLGDININYKDMIISKNDDEEILNLMEFKVLKMLIDGAKNDEIISKTKIEENLYGRQINSTVVSVYLVRIREKLRRIKSAKVEIETLYGKGFRLTVKNSATL